MEVRRPDEGRRAMEGVARGLVVGATAHPLSWLFYSVAGETLKRAPMGTPDSPAFVFCVAVIMTLWSLIGLGWLTAPSAPARVLHGRRPGGGPSEEGPIGGVS